MSDLESGCPVPHAASGAKNPADSCQPHLPHPTQGDATRDLWPGRLNLKVLSENADVINPLDPGFDYKKEFNSLDFAQLKKDIAELLTTSQDWWPADFGNYGPMIIRVAWHSAGTYRQYDGRGGAGSGQQRFAPLNSWQDNANTDKGRRLLWPIKKKYGHKLSWADLMVLAGNVAMEQMGFKTLGFGGGRVDAWEPENVYFGSEPELKQTQDRMSGEGDERELEKPLANTVQGLIYVDPEGPEGRPDPVVSAHDIRLTFVDGMGMTDEETVALIAGGHTFGKAHGAASDDEYVGPEPEAAPIEQQGLGWKNSYGTGKGDDTIVSGLEVTWTYHPTRWDDEYLHILFGYEWEAVKGEGGHWQWRPKDGAGKDMVPMAHSSGKREPRMFTTDIALRADPGFEKIARRFHLHQDEFEKAFAQAWFKLTHRDMGPKSRYLGPEVPAEDFIWQDPLPARDYEPIDDADVTALKKTVLDSGLTVPQLVKTAWASASTFRKGDKRGGANGAHIRLEPERSWEVNEPDELAAVLDVYEGIKRDFDAANGPKKVSIADLIVLGGDAAIEKAAADAGTPVEAAFTPGRVDATQDQTDPEHFSYLEPTADGFRNYWRPGHRLPAENLLIDRAAQLSLTPPEMTVLVGGLRALGATYKGTPLGVMTDRPGLLTNDFFVNLLELGNEWKPLDKGSNAFQASDEVTGEKKWTGTRNDLVFSSNSELRAIAEFYGADDAQEKFVRDFAAAWVKVSNLDRFDVR